MEGIHIVSFIPGRVRLKVAHLEGNPDLADRVQRELTVVAGVSSIDITPDTGSVLVKYDRAKVRTAESLDTLCARLADLFPGIDIAQVRNWLSK